MPVAHAPGNPVINSLELPYEPGDAARFIEALWRHLPAPPDGVLVGIIHLVGDRSQIQIRVSDQEVRQVIVQPGQILQVPSPADPSTWSVADNPIRTWLPRW